MISLDNGDKIQGDATTAAKVDFVISGLDANAVKQLADGQLANAIGDMYTADSADVVSGITLVNTNSTAEEVNLYVLPNGGTARRIIPVDLSLGVGYSLYTDGQKISVMDTAGQVLSSWSVDDTAGGTNGLTTQPPSSNAFYDHTATPPFDHFLHLLRARGHLHVMQFDDEQWTDVAGTTDITRRTQDVQIKVSNGDTEVGRIYQYFRGLTTGYVDNIIHWSLTEAILQFQISRHTSEALAVSYVQLKKDNTEGEMSNDGVGIKIENFVVTGHCWGGGSGSGDLSLDLTLTHNVMQAISIHHKPNTFVKWYVNGVLKATEETDYPTGTEFSNFVISHKTTGAASADNYLSVFNPILLASM